VMTLLLSAPHALFGLDPRPHLALAALLGAAVSLCLFVLLRTLSMPMLPALVIAVLALLFPWSDSVRMWPAASLNSVAVLFYLSGLIVALRGLDRRGRRGIAIHAGADLLYLLSILTYELAAGAVLLRGLLYLERAPKGRALRCWAADAVVVLAGLLYSLFATVSARHVGSISERIADLPDFVRESLLLFSSALQPFGTMGRPLQALVLLVAAGVLLLAVLWVRSGSDPALRAWLRWALIGLLAVGAAYFMFLASNLHPRDPGIDNRINLLAGPAICLLVYAVVAIACHLLFGRRAAVVAAAAAVLIAGGYWINLHRDAGEWRDAAATQAAILGEADHDLLPLPAGSTVLEFGYPATTAPEVPVFSRRWDLSGALQIRSGGNVVNGFPIYEGIKVSCGPRLLIDGGAGYGRFNLAYRKVFFYGDGSKLPVGSRQACRRSLKRFHPGPQEA